VLEDIHMSIALNYIMQIYKKNDTIYNAEKCIIDNKGKL